MSVYCVSMAVGVTRGRSGALWRSGRKKRTLELTALLLLVPPDFGILLSAGAQHFTEAGRLVVVAGTATGTAAGIAAGTVAAAACQRLRPGRRRRFAGDLLVSKRWSTILRSKQAILRSKQACICTFAGDLVRLALASDGHQQLRPRGPPLSLLVARVGQRYTEDEEVSPPSAVGVTRGSGQLSTGKQPIGILSYLLCTCAAPSHPPAPRGGSGVLTSG